MCVPITRVSCSMALWLQRWRGDIDMENREAQLRVVHDPVGFSPYSWDPQTGALEWNDRIRAMWGLPPDAAVDVDTFRAGVHPEDWPRVEAAIARCVDPDGDGFYALEYRVIGIDDGVERWVQTCGRTLFEDRKPVDFFGAVIEITEHKRNEARLRESEQRFRLFAENTNEVLWIGNAKQEAFDYLSPAYERIWGAKVGSFVPTLLHWAQTLHPDDRAQAIAWLAGAYAGEARTLEYRIIRSDGTIREIRDTAFPIRDRQGKICCVGGIAQDVTRTSSLQIYVVGVKNGLALRLISVLERAGYRVKHFASARSFLEVAAVLQPGCALLDTRSPAASDLAMLRELKAQGGSINSIVIGHEAEGIVPAVEAMKSGASDYLSSEFKDEALLAAVASAMTKIQDAAARDDATETAMLRIASLSAREREVLDGLLAGGSNKTIARGLGISPRTVELHRAHLMERIGARSLREVFQIALAAGLKAG